MKKGLLLSLAVLVPTVGLAVTKGKYHTGPVFGKGPMLGLKMPMGSDWKEIMPQEGSQLLDITVKAENLQEPMQALKKLKEFFELKTKNKAINDTLSDINSKITIIITSKDLKKLIPALLPLHKHLSMLAMNAKAEKANANVQKAFENLEKVFNKVILMKAEKLHEEAMKLTGEQKQKALGLSQIFLYGLTGGADEEMLNLQQKALNLQSKIMKTISKKQEQEIQKAIENSFKATIKGEGSTS